MDKEFIDKLYHELRLLCVTENIFQKEAIRGITSHLTEPQGDYVGLLRFLSYYGQRYILPTAVSLIDYQMKYGELDFSRIVDLGAGYGWLGRGISSAFSFTPVTFVDKRHWALIDIVADIESENGRQRVLDQMRDGDLIVMSELIHCLHDPREVLKPFSKWPMLVIEYYPVNVDYWNSYCSQIAKFNCSPTPSVRNIFPASTVIQASDAQPYEVCLVSPIRKKG